MTEGLTYLTVQDMLYINLQVTRKVNEYHFMRLEEGTFYQYGYGQSVDLAAQADRFFRGFIKNAPFTEGNDETAYVGYLAFLGANGHEVSGDRASLIAAAKSGGALPTPSPIADWHGGTHPSTRDAIEAVLASV